MGSVAPEEGVHDYAPPSSSAPADAHALAPAAAKRSLSVLQLAGITYFAASGGPYGFEDVVGAGGGVVTLVGLAVCLLVWSIPIALVTVELSCMMPEMGGHIIWVTRGLGPSYGFFNAAMAMMNNAFDTALYPVMFVDYLDEVFKGEDGEGMGPLVSTVIKLGVTLGTCMINIWGIDSVGDSSVLFVPGVISPFLVMVGMGVTKSEGKKRRISRPPGRALKKVEWGTFLSVLFWNTSGFDSAGTVAGEVAVEDVGRTYTRALGLTTVLVTLTYGVPTAVGLSFAPDTEEWEDGTWVRVAELIGGGWLKTWLAISGGISALGLLVTLTATSARALAGMGITGALPPGVAKLHPKHGTPYVAILIMSTTTFCLSPLPFDKLAELSMLFYAMSTALKFVALARLRFTEPDAPRPYRIWCCGYSPQWLSVWIAPPIICCLATAAACSWNTILLGSSTFAFSMFVFAVKRKRARKDLKKRAGAVEGDVLLSHVSNPTFENEVPIGEVEGPYATAPLPPYGETADSFILFRRVGGGSSGFGGRWGGGGDPPWG
mmetsp:Transcript_46259/g.148074  ORF Transcript_46259/g.148074 Transcript_46259/m.148074 type:complete len:547 (+) Transcript_46259:204-1844(+)